MAEKSKKRIVVYWSYFQNYHSARVREVLRLSKTSNWEVFPLALAGSANDHHQSELSDDLAGRVEVLVPERVDDPGCNPRVRAALKNLLDRVQPDIVMTPGYDGSVTFDAVRWCRRRRKGAVLMFDTQERDRPRPLWKEWLKRHVVRRYDAAFASGITSREYLVKLGLPAERVVTGYDAVDNAFFEARSDEVRRDACAWRNRLSLPEAYFLAAGRMIPKKGFPFLVRAFGRYAKREIQSGRVPWALVIIGDGPERAAVETEISRLDKHGQVFLPGYLSSLETAQYMGLANGFVMPSLCEEQWGLVVNEAMAAGLPVIASDICGATKDLVVDDVTGFTFPVGDEARLATLMDVYVRENDRLSAMGIAARKRVEAFSLDNFARQFFHAADLALAHARTR